jgi:hypothetical protein
MKHLIIAALVLSGCASLDNFVDTTVVTETKYVVRQATPEQKRLPPYPAPLPANATQLELAEWIAANEERQWSLENIIAELIKFYEKPVVLPAK